MKQLLYMIISIPLITNGQIDKGIKFEKGLSWNQLLGKAKSENKYIFLDCYATWCQPCKYMDLKVYTNERVGEFINKKFISVKVQVDTSKNDNEEVRQWYSDAHNLVNKYSILNLPTYLFFSPDGNIIHKDIGAMGVDEFITTVSNSFIPEKQYYLLLRNYKSGKKDYQQYGYLAVLTRKFGDKDQADIIASDYINNYLLNTNIKKIRKTDFEFIVSFPELLTSRSRAFKLFYNKGNEINGIVNIKGYAQDVVSTVVSKEEIEPFINKCEIIVPDWVKIANKINRKYNHECCDRAILDAKIKWYYKKKDWSQIAKYRIEKIEKYGVDTLNWFSDLTLNNITWETIFLHSQDTNQINTGIKWIQGVIRRNPDYPTYVDTYANLLYKVGQIKEALFWEQKAMQLEEQKAIKEKRKSDTVYSETLQKMRNGDPTWYIND